MSNQRPHRHSEGCGFKCCLVSESRSLTPKTHYWRVQWQAGSVCSLLQGWQDRVDRDPAGCNSLPSEPFPAQAKATDRWRSSNAGSRGVTRYGRSELVLPRGASMGGSAASRAGMASKPSWEGGPADPRRRSFILCSASPCAAGGVPCLARAASPWQLAMNPTEPAVLLGFARGAPDAGSARGFGASTAERGSRGCKRCGLFVAAGGLEMPVLRAAPGLQFTPCRTPRGRHGDPLPPRRRRRRRDS